MVQIISLPGMGLWDIHEAGLKQTGKTHHVAHSIVGLLDFCAKDHTPPELIFCDYDWLRTYDLQPFMGPDGELEFLGKTPMIVGYDGFDPGMRRRLVIDNLTARFGGKLNIIHCLDVQEQFESWNFRHMVKAFDLAAAKGPVTAEIFQDAWEALPRETALDDRGAQAAQRLGSLRR